MRYEITRERKTRRLYLAVGLVCAAGLGVPLLIETATGRGAPVLAAFSPLPLVELAGHSSAPNPAAPWDMDRALDHLRANAGPRSIGKCARFVRQAIEAGGLTIPRTESAKDYGSRLELAGFVAAPGDATPYRTGDIAVIEAFTKDAADGVRRDHPHGHMAMYDGTQWICDFKQAGATPYPGSDYEKATPPFVIYRYRQ